MQECDLVMKGGLTSGVVYPFAITELSERFVLRQIGGTSAGAIAATLAAAAEYRRQASGNGEKAGFDQIKTLADQLASNMESMFQPTYSLSGPFRLMIASISPLAKERGAFAAVLREIPGVFPLQLLAFLALAIGGSALGWFQGNIWIAFAGVLAGLLVSLGWAMGKAIRWLMSDLPEFDFGMCSGKTLRNADHAAFGDWIAASIESVAGTGDRQRPLTIGDLEDHGISLAAMTTDLATARPYHLPLRTKIYYFSRTEMARLLDDKTLDYLCDPALAHTSHDPAAPGDLFRLKSSRDFPVYLVARMSLSFPGLISGVPLWRYDDGVRTVRVEGEDKPKPEMRRCLFSDGGISSNFPIHFFDSLMPQRPTLGISLGEWEEARHGTGKEKRIHIAERSIASHQMPVRPVKGLGGFAGSIVNTAKDWQDNMQSMMPGYADRIVTVLLDPDKEGGMNLNMDEATILQLQEYGRMAGKALCAKFDYEQGGTGFDQHRYLRAISLLPKLEEALEGFDEAMRNGPVGVKNAMTGRAVLTGFASQSYTSLPSSWRKGPLASFADALAKLGKNAKDNPDANVHGRDGLPKVDAAIRLTAIADRDAGDS